MDVVVIDSLERGLTSTDGLRGGRGSSVSKKSSGMSTITAFGESGGWLKTDAEGLGQVCGISNTDAEGLGDTGGRWRIEGRGLI